MPRTRFCAGLTSACAGGPRSLSRALLCGVGVCRTVSYCWRLSRGRFIKGVSQPFSSVLGMSQGRGSKLCTPGTFHSPPRRTSAAASRAPAGASGGRARTTCSPPWDLVSRRFRWLTFMSVSYLAATTNVTHVVDFLVSVIYFCLPGTP